MYEDNFNALLRISKRYRNYSILFVPQRDEVGILGRENMDTVAVERFLKDSYIGYKTCDLDGGDYMPQDGHPNGKDTKKF